MKCVTFALLLHRPMQLPPPLKVHPHQTDRILRFITCSHPFPNYAQTTAHGQLTFVGERSLDDYQSKLLLRLAYYLHTPDGLAGGHLD